MSNLPEYTLNDEFIECPWCHHEDQQSWEIDGDEGEIDCAHCGKEIRFSRIVSISYRAEPVAATPPQPSTPP